LLRITRIVTIVALVLVVCAGSAARAETIAAPTKKVLVYHADQPIPAGYHVERRTRWGLAVSGIAMFAAVYIPTAAAAWYDTHDGTPLYVVPVFGPLLAIPKKTADDCVEGDHNPCIDFDEFIIAFFVADAVIQATSLVLTWRGFAGRDMLVRNDVPRATLLPGPIGNGGYGAWLSARF
jgi:hypothetical protein